MSLAKDFTVALSGLKFVGKNLSRPESVIACRDALVALTRLWAASAAG